MSNYDLIGNIAIVKFQHGILVRDKKKFALQLLKEHKNIKTILEKSQKFSGRLRTQKTKWIAGEKTKEVLYRENNCEFRFNVDTCYFSPRLSAERNEIASLVKKGERVLVMFGGVAPFAIVIAKNSKASEVVSVELGRDCNKYALENVKRNKLENVRTIQSDVRKVVPKLRERFSRIIMTRPNLKDSFLDVAFRAILKNGVIHYYGFYAEDKFEELKKLIFEEALKTRKKIKILKVKKAGEVGKRKFRFRVDVEVLN